MRKPRVLEGPIVRNRKQQKAYDRYRGPLTNCQFCDLDRAVNHVIAERNLFWIISNLFPYHVWDGAKTGDHLLVIPKRHVDSVAHFNDEEKMEYIEILGEYEQAGYSSYARAPQNGHKSVVHQHTHLIEVGESINSQLYLRKPFINFAR